MKVLHVSASYKPAFVYGGPVFSLSALTEALVLDGITTEVFTTNANGHENLQVDTTKTHQVKGVSVRYYPRYFAGLFFSPKLIFDLWKSCRHYDVVHINSWWNFVSVFACVVCILRRVTPIVSLRGTMSDFSFDHRKVWIKRCIHAVFGRFLLKRSVIHFTSQSELTQALKWFEPSRYFVLRNINEIPQKSPSANKEHSGNELVFMGRLHPIKNLEVLIEAMRQVDVPCTLKVYGKGEPGYVESLKKMAGENVQWMDWIEGEDRFRVLREADIMLLISQYENFGNVVVEALSQGTAVICAKDTGISDFVETQNLGWTVDPVSTEVSKVISQAIRDQEKRERIRLIGADVVGRTFGQKALGSKYLEEYRKIAGRKRFGAVAGRI